MKLTLSVGVSVADQVWLATALLHHEDRDRMDFSKPEIRRSCDEIDAEGARRPAISQHISTHCVASRPASPAKHRMLTRTRTGRRRLFRPGDDEHSDRREGKTAPLREEVPEKYRYLIDWYENEYAKPRKGGQTASQSQGATAETLMKLMGRISREDADELIQIIDDCCGRVDANEW